MRTADMRTENFRAMGCAAEVTIVGDDVELVACGRRLIEQLEQCWSRFLPESDISRINGAAGRAVEVDPSTVQLVTAMVQGWVATEGAFDPTLLAQLVRLGYAASWDDPTRVTSLTSGVSWHGRPTDIEIDVRARSVRVPAGTFLDAGGIGKGLAADLVVDSLLADGAAGALVNLGGDVRVRGVAPHPLGWLVGVADVHDDSVECAQVALLDGGVATSGTLRRVWSDAQGSSVHHLLQPQTGAPLPTGADQVVAVTVVAGTAALADVWTKAVMVQGPMRALPWLDTLGLGARVVMGGGQVRVNDAWNTYAVQS